MADPDDATKMLIAALLVEDHAEADGSSGDLASEATLDAEYSVASRRKPAAKSNRRGKRSRITSRDADAAALPSAAVEGVVTGSVEPSAAVTSDALPIRQSNGLSAGNMAGIQPVADRKRRREAGEAHTVPKGWTNEEERLFEEAMHMFGRDWAACAKHIGTRPPRAVTSHCQKWLIKLCIDGKLPPPKILESGPGYTLSGKLLNPYCASARAYGLKPPVVERLRAEHAASLAGLEAPKYDSDGNIVTPLLSPKPPAKFHNPLQPSKARKALSKPQQPPQVQQEAQRDWVAAERTEYSMARPRREASAGRGNGMGATSESLRLLRPRDFMGTPGSGALLSQPFSLEVSPRASVTMEFHAHLSTLEIIGLLGGMWLPSQRRLVVSHAFPCRPAKGTESGVSVELDPEDEVTKRALMAEMGLVPAGWYHSHPIFDTHPSQKDCENQRNYQALFRAEACNGARADEPFVAAIVGPYDLTLPDERSATSFFVVQSKGSEAVPFRLCLEAAAPWIPAPEDAQRLLQLAAMTAGASGRVDLSEEWRPFTRLEGRQPEGPPLTRLQKLHAALKALLTQSPPAEGNAHTELWLDSLCAGLRIDFEQCGHNSHDALLSSDKALPPDSNADLAMPAGCSAMPDLSDLPLTEEQLDPFPDKFQVQDKFHEQGADDELALIAQQELQSLLPLF